MYSFCDVCVDLVRLFCKIVYVVVLIQSFPRFLPLFQVANAVLSEPFFVFYPGNQLG